MLFVAGLPSFFCPRGSPSLPPSLPFILSPSCLSPFHADFHLCSHGSSSDARTREEMSGTFAVREAFNVLQELLTDWLKDLMNVSGGLSAEKESDYLLSHFYRWLRNPESLLYDPAMHRMTHNLMKKVSGSSSSLSRIGKVMSEKCSADDAVCSFSILSFCFLSFPFLRCSCCSWTAVVSSGPRSCTGASTNSS